MRTKTTAKIKATAPANQKNSRVCPKCGTKMIPGQDACPKCKYSPKTAYASRREAKDMTHAG